MSGWLVVWLVVGLVTTAALAAVAAWLVHHVILVGRSAGRMQEELGALTEEISRASARVSDRAARLQMPRGDRGRKGRR